MSARSDVAKVAVHARFRAESGRGDELVTAIDDMFEAALDELLAEEPEVGFTHLLRARGLPVER